MAYVSASRMGQYQGLWRVPMYGPMYVLSEQDIMAALPPGLHVTDVQLTSRGSDEPVTIDTRGSKGTVATPAAR